MRRRRGGMLARRIDASRLIGAKQPQLAIPLRPRPESGEDADLGEPATRPQLDEVTLDVQRVRAAHTVGAGAT